MNFTSDDTIAKLVAVAEIVALDECGAKQHGQPECRDESDNEDNWCLVCLARQALEECPDE